MSLPGRYTYYTVDIHHFLCRKHNMYCMRVDFLIMRGRACKIGTYFLLFNHSPGNQSGREGGCGEESLKERSRYWFSYFTNFLEKCWELFEPPLIWYWTKNREGNQILVHYAMAEMAKAMEKARGYKDSSQICYIKYRCHLFKPFKFSTYWGWDGVWLVAAVIISRANWNSI